MSETVTTNVAEFHAVMRKWLANTSRNLPDALNSRMFYLLLRVFVLLPPTDPKTERNKIRAYLNEHIGDYASRIKKKTGKRPKLNVVFSRVHLIAQSKNAKDGKKGLYGLRMKDSAAELRRKSIGSVGYLKSGLVKAMRQINGHFTQAGGQLRKDWKAQKEAKLETRVSSNAALSQIASQYGLKISSNVGVFRGAKAKGDPARPGFNPFAWAQTSTKIKDSEMGKVEAMYNAATSRAMADEMAYMEAAISNAVESAANEALASTPGGHAG